MTKDLMYADETQRLVVDAYRALNLPGGPGARFYSDEQLAVVPAPAREWALGVGNPVTHADLRAGEVVIDLGCGAGIDTLLAADAVGASGRSIGIDLLAEMAQRGRTSAREAGADNATFACAQMEALPLPDRSVDVVISNGAVNLSARKSRVLAEAYRILRPGGRVCLADLTVRDEELPAEVRTHPAAWAG